MQGFPYRKSESFSSTASLLFLKYAIIAATDFKGLKMHYPLIYLKPREEKRLHGGHLWVYSNEIDTKKNPLSQYSLGQLVTIAAANGKLLGTGYINPHNLLCIRLLTTQTTQTITEDFFYWRLQIAQKMRDRIYPKPYYRMVFGESDLLPGLVIDRFNQTYVVQITTHGMELLLDKIISALINLTKPDCIILRADSKHREQENLPLYQKVIHGDTPEVLHIEENDTLFEVPALSGQKTGWFYDHRNNRALLRTWSRDKRILDLFSYAGAWGLPAATSGASQVMCIDASQTAIEQVQKNAVLNQVQHKVTTQCADAFDALKALARDQEQFDIIVLDPPAFIKRKKDFDAGVTAYQRLNTMALKLLKPEGMLISASCSMHLSQEQLIHVLQRSSTALNQPIKIIAQGGQGYDHPVHPAIAETQYLKSIFVLRNP